MSDYIRREDVLKEKKTGTFANGICLVAEPCVTVEYIESLEPADVVQVVRCKDCKYRESDDFCVGRGFPYQLVAGDEFCSRAKTKEHIND